MPEQVVWNKKLLMISSALGLVAMVLFFVYDVAQQRKREGTLAQVLRWTRDMQPGDAIQREDIEAIEVRREMVRQMGETLILQSDRDAGLVAPGEKVRRAVRRNDFVRSEDVRNMGVQDPAEKIETGKRAIVLRVDPYYAPGDVLAPNGRVDVLGMMGNPPKTYTLIQNLKVLGVGGRSEERVENDLSEKRRADPGQRVYRSVLVEMSPTVAEKWLDLEARLHGTLRLLVRNPTDRPDPRKGFDNVINPEVVKLMETLQPTEEYNR